MSTNITLVELFHDTLKDLYFTEHEILKALPIFVSAAMSNELRATFEKHIDETEAHFSRLEDIFTLIGKLPERKPCQAIAGLISEGDEIIQKFQNTPAGDAALIAAAQSIEHYEITRYGCLKRWAEVLGMSEAAGLVGLTLREECSMDGALTTLANASANQVAVAA